jgi:hypothetical protein
MSQAAEKARQVEKVRKLLALARGKANEHEARLAAEIASQTMARHGIKASDLSAKAAAKPYEFPKWGAQPAWEPRARPKRGPAERPKGRGPEPKKEAPPLSGLGWQALRHRPLAECQDVLIRASRQPGRLAELEFAGLDIFVRAKRKGMGQRDLETLSRALEAWAQRAVREGQKERMADLFFLRGVALRASGDIALALSYLRGAAELYQKQALRPGAAVREIREIEAEARAAAQPKSPSFSWRLKRAAKAALLAMLLAAGAIAAGATAIIMADIARSLVLG